MRATCKRANPVPRLHSRGVRTYASRSPDIPTPRSRFGCGVDVVELPRIRQAIARGGAAFMRRVFTPQETAYAQARPKTCLLHLAGRFAAKEAVIKAVSQVDPRRRLAMRDVEVVNDRLGRPHALLRDRHRGGTRLRLHISLSHVHSVAVASAIAVR